MSVIMTYLLHFLCLCNYENRMRFGMVELETGIPFVSALTFRYLWQKSLKIGALWKKRSYYIVHSILRSKQIS